MAWRQTINLGPFSRQERMILVGVITMIILAANFVFIYLIKLRPDGDQQQKGEQGNSNRWAIQAILVGLFALLIGGWPFWATDLPIMLVFPWDRFTLPMMVGGSILDLNAARVGLVHAEDKSGCLRSPGTQQPRQPEDLAAVNLQVQLLDRAAATEAPRGQYKILPRMNSSRHAAS